MEFCTYVLRYVLSGMRAGCLHWNDDTVAAHLETWKSGEFESDQRNLYENGKSQGDMFLHVVW